MCQTVHHEINGDSIENVNNVNNTMSHSYIAKFTLGILVDNNIIFVMYTLPLSELCLV